MVLDFPHKLASHCETGATMNLLRFFNIEISEPLVFGIGSGMYFGHLPFLKMNFIPVTSFRTLPGKIFGTTCKRLNVKWERKTFKNQQQAMDELDVLLDKGIPVGVQVGVYFLPFFPPEYRMHYNMHNMVIIGREDGHYFVSDPVIEKIEKISHADLMRVRFAKGPFAPEGKMYWMTGVPASVDLRQPVIDGIKRSSFQMIGQPFWMIGTLGIKFLSKRLRFWPEKLGDKRAAQYLTQLIQSQEEIGTGGSGYRFIFGAFLKEAASITGKEELLGLSKEMGDVANKWREFSYTGARFVKNRGDATNIFGRLADILMEIAEREKKLFTDLKKIQW